MSEIIKSIYDKNGNIIRPVTTMSAIINDNGNTLEEHVQQTVDQKVEEEVDKLVNMQIPSNRLIPDGGEAGQVLVKNSANNYDISWVNAQLDTAIEKITGTLQNPIILSELESGVYRIIGNIYIVRDDTTYFVDASGSNLYIVSKEDNTVTKVTVKGIYIYNFTDDGYITSRYTTLDDIIAIKSDILRSFPTKLSDLENDLGFMTSDDIDAKINEQLNNKAINQIVDERINSTIGSISENNIANLFN